MAEEYPSPDLVEPTRRVFDAVDCGDFDDALESIAPDAVWTSEVLEMTFEGLPAIRGFLEQWSSAYEAFEVQAEDIVDLGNGVVLCVFMNRSSQQDGVSEPLLRFALVIVWATGAIRRVTGDEDIDRARAAAEQLAAGGARDV